MAEPVLWVAALRALYLQALHPRVMHGTWQNTAFADPKQAWALLTTLGYLLGNNGVAMAGLVARYALLAICLPALISVAPHAWRARNMLVSLVRRAKAGRAAVAP